MGNLTIYKASAGSGKTFRLTGEYLKLIFNPETRFYNILAVTFTNKATAEMRERILNSLFHLSQGKINEYAVEIKKEYKLTDTQIKTKARLLLNYILFNYSRFNVSTIDSFFQKILKAFAYETGLNSGFNVELNLQSILEISIEQFFEKINKNKIIKNWLSNYAIQKIEEGKNWDIEKDIYNFSKDAFNEIFFSFSESQLSEFSNINTFANFKKELITDINEFVANINNFGKQAVAQMQKHQLDVADFFSGVRGVAGFLSKLSYASKNNIKEPGSNVLKAHKSPDGITGWCSKTSKIQNEIIECVNNGLAAILENYINYYNEHIIDFNTKIAIYKGIDVFAVIVEVYNQLNAYCREKNIFLLPLASPLLSKMIGTNDAPFIYEKTGDYLHHFMIDEFQDTSRIQWENFSPLFLNGISQNKKSLVVGDVKQSIYRWRNGDWTLLNNKLEQGFKNFGVKNEHLEINWRSKPEIIQFNNYIFNNIPILAEQYLTEKKAPELYLSNYSSQIANIYKSAEQQIANLNNDKQGYVQVQFYKDSTDLRDFEAWCLNQMIITLETLLNNGTQPKDIAILVRRGKEGALVAKHLMEYIQANPDKKNQFSFVSNDSVLLGSSSLVLLLVNLIEFITNTDNIECRASILFNYTLLNSTPTEAAQKLSEVDINNLDCFLTELPKAFKGKHNGIKKLNFVDMTNQLLHIFIYSNHTKSIQLQLPFINAFQDLVLDYMNNNGSDISGFLTWWKEYGLEIPITLSDEQNAIRIVTIHKSKGLEYKSVIIPFTNWKIDQLSKNIWCKSPYENTIFPIVPVMYSSSLANSNFADAYWDEKIMALIDNINLLYVAFTRAECTLHVFAPTASPKGELKSINDILFKIIDTSSQKNTIWNYEQQIFTSGLMVENKENSQEILPSFIPLSLTDKKQNLHVKLTVNEIFKDDNGVLSKKKNKGSIYHKIMEKIISSDDIEHSVSDAVSLALLTTNEAEIFTKLLNKSITKLPQKKWFNNSYKVLTESSFFLQNHETKRPDRIMISESEIIVVDYKFTKNKLSQHNEQIINYMALVKLIEKKPVRGYLWYVTNNEIIEVFN